MDIVRGDTKNIKFARKDFKGNLIKEKPDKVFFTVKKSYYNKNYLFQKQLDKDIVFNDEDFYYYFTIEPKDTDNLEYGKHVFDIEIISGEVKKTIAKGILNVTEEVTFAENEE